MRLHKINHVDDLERTKDIINRALTDIEDYLNQSSGQVSEPANSEQSAPAGSTSPTITSNNMFDELYVSDMHLYKGDNNIIHNDHDAQDWEFYSTDNHGQKVLNMVLSYLAQAFYYDNTKVMETADGGITVFDIINFNDTNTQIFEDDSGNLTFKDVVYGAEITLNDLATAFSDYFWTQGDAFGPKARTLAGVEKYWGMPATADGWTWFDDPGDAE